MTSKLDLWIAATMRPREEARSRLESAGIDFDAAQVIARELKANGLNDISTLSRTKILALFGPPAEASSSAVSYDLALWPLHRYEWRFDKHQHVTGSGFVGRDPMSIPLSSEEDLRPWFHTELAVRRTFGGPNSEAGWWPEYTLSYGPTDDRAALDLTFCHGLLTRADRRFSDSHSDEDR